MLARSDLPKENRDPITHIRESVIELIQLSNLLMNAIRVEKELYTYTYTNFSLNELIDDVLASFQSVITNKNIKLTVQSSPDMPLVHGDRERLSSALHVFVENAVNYTPMGGSIDIKIKNFIDALYVEITDSGIGISSDEKMRLYKKFYRSERARKIDPDGVGVGLSIAKNIIERHRGTVGVSSKGIGRGSTFWFTLPLSVK
jgi:signal transduction histidine kinase